MSGLEIQGLVDDIAAIARATRQDQGPVVLVIVSAGSPALSVAISSARGTGSEQEKRLTAKAKGLVVRLKKHRGSIADIPRPVGGYRVPVWRHGTLAGWIFGFSKQKGDAPVFQVASKLVSSALEIEHLRGSLEQNNAYFQKTVHDLKSFATGFLIASEMWSKPKSGNLEQLGELAVLSYHQAKQMLVVLQRLAVDTYGQPIEITAERVGVTEMLRAACDFSKALLHLPHTWAPAIKVGKNKTLWGDAAQLGPALAGVIAVACGFERGAPVEIEASQLKEGMQLVIRERGESTRRRVAAAPLRDERFVPLDRVERIIAAHGGSIQVALSKTKRHIFTIMLPTKP